MKLIIITFLFIVLTTNLSACDDVNNLQIDAMEAEPVLIRNIDNKLSEKTENSVSEQPSERPIYINEYHVDLEVFPEARIIKCIEKVKYKNTTGMELNQIYFNNYLNAFSKDSKDKPYFENFENKVFRLGKDYGYTNILNISINKEDVSFETNETVLQISLLSPLKVDEEISITIEFESYIPKINHRTGANEKAIWCGNFLPLLAVYDEFGWHKEPYYKAGDPFYSEISNFEVTIKTPMDYSIVATGNKGEVNIDDYKSTTFSAKMVRDFAFAISENYQHATLKTPASTEINLYYYSNIDPEPLLKMAEKSLEYYSKVIGSYPYEQLSIVETGLFGSIGMEYPQIIFLDSELIKKDSVIRTIAHEIGHQWFYNIIGSNSVKDSWLDEGLTMAVQEGIFYDAEGLHEKMKKDYNNLKSKLKEIHSKSLLQDLSIYKSWSDYYNIQYEKGKLMIYSLRLKMGEEKFSEFLKTYYSKYSFGIANRNDFMETAETIYGNSLAEFFEQWMQDYDLPQLN